MEDIITYLIGLAPIYKILLICTLIFLTALAIFPGHNDIFLILLILSRKTLDLNLIQIFCIFVFSVAFAETILFFIGSKYGHKILESKFILKKFPRPYQELISREFNSKPYFVTLLVRFTPVLRGLIVLFLSSFKISPVKFFKHYIYILPLYAISLISLFSLSEKFVDANNNFIKYSTYAVLAVFWLALVKIIHSNLQKALNESKSV